MNTFTIAFLLFMSMTIVSCGGKGGSDNNTGSNGAVTVDSAGGTVSGPDGVQLSIPAGALDASTTFRIAKSSSGAPPLVGIRAITPIYEVTPHGAAFTTDALVTIPVDTSQLSAGQKPFLLRSQPSGTWEVLNNVATSAGKFSADVSSLSWYAIGVCQSPVIGTPPAYCPSNNELKLEYLDSNSASVPVQRDQYGVALPIPLYLASATTITVRVTWTRPPSIDRTDHVGVIGLPIGAFTRLPNPSSERTARAAPIGYNDYGFEIDPRVLAGASGPNGTIVRIWAFAHYDVMRAGSIPYDSLVSYSADIAFRVRSTATVPVFEPQPTNQTVAEGQTASFTATATSSPSPTVQWYKVGTPPVAVGSFCSGSSNSTTCTYTTPALSSTDSGGQYYAVATNNAGTVQSNTVTVTVTGTAMSYTVGGVVSGLSGTGFVLQNNGGDNLALSSNGTFTFATSVANGSGYAVTVLSHPSGQSCLVTNGTGTISGAHVTNVAVSCTTSGSGTVTLPRTGQTTCFAATGMNVIACANTGQDGELLKGVPWPNPRFTVSGDCVTDNLTGLMWVRTPDNVDRTWQQALNYANGLTVCGYSDWRLPNRKELESLGYYEYAQGTTAAWLNTQGFSNVPEWVYWSSSTVSGGTANAWNVDTWSGSGGAGAKDYTNYTWSVRTGGGASADLPETGQTTCYSGGTYTSCAGTGQDGDIKAGAAWPSPRFTSSGDCVTDNLTGLRWAGSPDSTTRTWQQALDYANGLTLCGYSDWRLPNVNELASLIHTGYMELDKDCSGSGGSYPCATNAEWLISQGFSNVQGSDYWTSSTFVWRATDSFCVTMYSGSMSVLDKASSGYVWPVRGGQ